MYLAIGVFKAWQWSKNYDAKNTSFPNNGKTFLINTLLWPL
jgi:hypothetical protein